jgi:hypothetical protein
LKRIEIALREFARSADVLEILEQKKVRGLCWPGLCWHRTLLGSRKTPVINGTSVASASPTTVRPARKPYLIRPRRGDDRTGHVAFDSTFVLNDSHLSSLSAW